MLTLRSILLFASSVVGFIGCGQNYMDLAEFNYNRLAHGYAGITDAPTLPVIFVPGVKGSKIIKCNNGKEWEDIWPCDQNEGTELWGTSGNVSLFRKYDDLMLGYQFVKIAKDEPQFGETIPNINDYKRKNIKDGALLESYALGWTDFILGRANIYGRLRQFLIDRVGYEEDHNLFFMPYDWRLDNRIAAVKLALTIHNYRQKYYEYIKTQFILGKTVRSCTDLGKDNFDGYWSCLQKKHKDLFNENGEIKFVLISHSMGGLVAKYFVNVLQGGQDVHKLILMGVPIYGSVDALYSLREGEFPETFLGELFNLRFFSQGSTRTVLFSMPSAFQLLPTYEGSIRGKSLKDFGLDLASDLDLNDFKADPQNLIFKNYLEFGLIPGFFRFQKYVPIAETSYAVFAERLLLAYLKSAQCFNRAIAIDRERSKALAGC